MALTQKRRPIWRRIATLILAGGCGLPAFLWAASPTTTHKTVAAKEAPQRIASTTVTSDEILFALLPPGQGREHIVALSLLADDLRYANRPEEGKNIKARVGNDVEALARLRPDLIVLSAFNRPEFIAHVDKLGIRRFTQKSIDSLADIRQNINALGNTIGRAEAAKKLVADMDRDLASLKPLKRRPRVLVFDPEGYAYGPGTTMHDIIETAGGQNAVSELGVKGWKKISLEALAKTNPEWLIVPGHAQEKETWLAARRRESLWQAQTAVRHGHVIMVPAAQLFATSQYAVQAVLAVHAGLAQTP